MKGTITIAEAAQFAVLSRRLSVNILTLKGILSGPLLVHLVSTPILHHLEHHTQRKSWEVPPPKRNSTKNSFSLFFLA